MSETPDDQRLTPAQILLIVVVSALVLLFIVLLLGRATGGESEPGASTAATEQSPPGSTEEGAVSDGEAAEDDTPAEPEAPTEQEADAEPEYFASPSGNILCALTTDSTDCVIMSFTYDPADAGACAEDDAETAGSHLRVEPAGASMPCDPLVVAGDVPVLDYGESISAHGYTCASEESGVTCRHTDSGYGFSVARAGYELF